jgi:hypothetical protein
MKASSFSVSSPESVSPNASSTESRSVRSPGPLRPPYRIAPFKSSSLSQNQPSSYLIVASESCLGKLSVNYLVLIVPPVTPATTTFRHGCLMSLGDLTSQSIFSLTMDILHVGLPADEEVEKSQWFSRLSKALRCLHNLQECVPIGLSHCFLSVVHESQGRSVS